jgi:hypothetical protein
MEPLGRAAGFGRGFSFENLAVSGSAVGLTVPNGAVSALISVDNVEVRYRIDGSNPTTTVGHKLPLDTFMEIYRADLDYIKFISTGAATNVFVTYYQE